MIVAGRRVPRRDARRRAARELARRHRRARQGRLARRAAALAAARGARPAVAARVAVDPARHARRTPSRVGLRSGFGSPMLRARLPEGVHGRHARLADRLDARRQRRADHERRRARRDRAARRRSRASPSPCTRSATARTARRSTRSSRRATSGGRSACASASSTRQLLAPEDLARFAELGVACSVQFSHAPSDRDLADRSGRARPTAPTRSARCSTPARCVVNGSDAPIEELDPLAGIRAGVRRTIDEPARLASRAGADGRRGVPRDVRRARVARARRAAPRHAHPRPRRRSRRARPRPVGRPRRAGRRDDGRRPLGAQPAALGLTV